MQNLSNISINGNLIYFYNKSKHIVIPKTMRYNKKLRYYCSMLFKFEVGTDYWGVFSSQDHIFKYEASFCEYGFSYIPYGLY